MHPASGPSDLHNASRVRNASPGAWLSVAQGSQLRALSAGLAWPPLMLRARRSRVSEGGAGPAERALGELRGPRPARAAGQPRDAARREFQEIEAMSWHPDFFLLVFVGATGGCSNELANDAFCLS